MTDVGRSPNGISGNSFPGDGRFFSGIPHPHLLGDCRLDFCKWPCLDLVDREWVSVCWRTLVERAGSAWLILICHRVFVTPESSLSGF